VLLLLLAGGLAGCGPADLAQAFSSPPSATPVLPTATAIPPTATPAPPTATAIPPTATPVPPSATPLPPTATPVPPTAPPAPPTETPALPTAAPAPPTEPPAPPVAEPPVTPPEELPASVRLPMPNFEYQKLNNCGPCVTLMAMSVMGIETSQQRVADALRPNQGDKNVDSAEISAYLARFDLHSRVMVGGDTLRLRRLTAAGIPVIVEQLLQEDDDISHFRLVRGYDEAQQEFITGDSYFAPTYNLDYAVFERLWRMFNHRYVPVWRADQAATVQAILGDDWDEPVMYTHARDRALAAVQASPEDAAWWLALGHSQYGLGEWDLAIRAYLKSVSLGGLTKRVLWYQWWPVTALNNAGRYEEAITWADGAIKSAGVYAEMRYERAVALQALDRKAEAITELKQAIVDDPNYGPARDLLAAIEP
jgi:tetratricopeptide (TPR) repeat protein